MEKEHSGQGLRLDLIGLAFLFWLVFLFTPFVAGALAGAPTRPHNGYIFFQNGCGGHHLVINNGRCRDAIVKLRHPSGRAVLSFYVRSGESVTIETVPEGNYQIQFALGSSYARGRGRFTGGMETLSFPNINQFKTHTQKGMVYKSAVTCTLHPVSRGNIRVKPIKEANFFRN